MSLLSKPGAAFLPERLFMILLLPAMLLACWGVWQPYSYWIDEIYSVVAAAETLPDMFTRWILIDVHPPLYQVLLNLWVHAFGTGEAAVRSLSTLVALGVVALALALFRQRRDLAGFLVMVLSMPYFFYNAQEARSYIFLYAFGLLATHAVIRRQDVLLLATLVLLSWVHYFGLFLALSMLFVQVMQRRQITPASVVALLLMLAWLPIHLRYGALFGKASGGFWIRVDGPGETLANFFSVLSPAFDFAYRMFPAVAVVYAMSLLLALGYFPWRRLQGRAVAEPDLLLSLSLALFIAGVMAVDQVVPMSTKRNFLVAAPILLYVLFRIAQDLLPARRLHALLMLWLLVQLPVAIVLLQHKHSEIQNYRRTTVEVIRLMDQGYSGHYLEACKGNQGYHSDALNNLYMQRLDTQGRHLQLLCLDELAGQGGKLAILACHQGTADELRARVPAGYTVRSMDSKGLCALMTHTGNT